MASTYLADYAKEHDLQPSTFNLLDEWESPIIKLKNLAANSKKLLQLVNKAKL